MINKQGKGLRLTYQERQEKAKEMIGFLAAWDIGRDDAENILAVAYGDIRGMTAEDFIKSGKSIVDFMKLLVQPKEVHNDE